MIKETSPDKIRGKLVKYQLGDCLTIQQDDKYIGAIMTGKFNKYYNLTFMDFMIKTKPTIGDYINGRLFGTRFGSWEELQYGVDQRMVQCKYLDNELKIEKIGMINLIPDFVSAGYAYLDNIAEIFNYYDQEINVRIEKSKDAEKFPAIAFVGRHLIETKKITQ
jgi:hypothetical protein